MQNEENVVYRLLVYPGHVRSRSQSLDPFTFTGNEALLHFGTPMMNSQQIIVTPQELTQNNFEIKIGLTVAGKKSPVKSSQYILNLRNIDLNNPSNFSSIVISMEENQLISDKQEQLGTTRETTLFSVLGRNP